MRSPAGCFIPNTGVRTMKAKSLVSLVICFTFLLAGSASFGQVSVEYLGPVAATGISADGSVVVGNTIGNYETFRWTQETGTQLLGRATVPVLGGGAGGPSVSDDGNFISATILGSDQTYMTPGRWNIDTGWEECLPPSPPGGILFDQAYGSGWAISGDGSTVTGLFWFDTEDLFGAHALAWDPINGARDLTSSVGNSRANAASYDGSVIVGWDEAPFGTWMPTVWENGVLTHLTETTSFCMANAVSSDGNLIGGSSVDENDVRVAAVWTRGEDGWDEHLLGALPGTGNPFGEAMVNDISDDHSIIVGTNSWDPGYSTGFIFTQEDGLIDVYDFLADNDITFDPALRIASLSGISGDGKVICGVAAQTQYPWGYESFLIHLEDNLSATPDLSVALQLGDNYPNPFNPETTIPVNMKRDGNARLEIYNAAGHRIRTLHSGHLSQGRHQFSWNGRDDQSSQVSSGVYFSRLTDSSGQSASRRMVLVK